MHTVRFVIVSSGAASIRPRQPLNVCFLDSIWLILLAFRGRFGTFLTFYCCFTGHLAPAGKRGDRIKQNKAFLAIFWLSLLAKSATFRGKALHRKFALSVNFIFYYWRTVESCRTYHFFQVDWTKIWSIFAIIINQKL